MIAAKRKILFLSVIIVIIIVFISLYCVISQKSNFSSSLSYTYMNYGFSSQGIVSEPNTGNDKLGYVHIMDFKSKYNIALCTKPNCKHDDEGCFAHVLADPKKGYHNLVIYDSKLYYGQTRSEFQGGKIKNYLDLYESTLSGDKINKIATFDSYYYAESIYIQNGYVFAFMSKAEDTTQNDNLSEQKETTYNIGIVNLSNKKSFIASEKKGYNNAMLFLGIHKDTIYYEYISSDSQSSSNSKLYIYEYNFKKKNEKIWSKNYNAVDGDKYFYFKILNGKMIILEPNASFDKYIVYSADLNDNKKNQLGYIEFSPYLNFNPYILGDKIFINKYDTDGLTVLKNSCFDLITNQQKDVTGFTQYSIVNRVEDTLLLFSEKSNQYATISVDDYVNSNAKGLTLIKQALY